MIIFKKIILKTLSEALTLLPFTVLIKIQRKKLLLPLYHTVSDRRIPHIIHLFQYRSVKQFEKDMDFFQKHFSPVSLNDLMNSINGNIDLPDNSFLLTFDDGYREIVEIVAPILKKRSIPAVFFLNSKFIDNKEMFFRNKASLIIERIDPLLNPEVINKLSTIVFAQKPTISNLKTAILGVNYKNRHLLDEAAEVLQIDINEYLQVKQPYMNRDEIRDLINQGFMIGSHSIDHPLFMELPLDKQLMQVSVSLRKLKEQFTFPYNAFAFPHTDLGVSKEFYDLTHFNGQIDVSFGTSNFLKGYCDNNLQRQPMERGNAHANLIYRRLLSQEIIYDIKNRLHF
jgi:peptidoglycan/xylan/chitin deacetylase (PgdA/CDA1 family)